MKLVYANVGLLLAVAVMILGTPITALAQGTASYPMQVYAFTAVLGRVGGDDGNGSQRYCQDPLCVLRAGLSLPSGVTVTSIALDGCFFLDFPYGIEAHLWRFDRREQPGDLVVQRVVSYAHDSTPGCFRVFNSNIPPEINSPETIDNDNFYYALEVQIGGDGTNSTRLKGILVNYNLP